MTGSIQEKNGKYYAVLNFKDVSGKRKQKWICTGLNIRGNKKKAEQMLAEIVAEYDYSDYIEPTKTLLCDFIKQWIEINKHNVQVTTYDGYIHMLNRHIYPYFKQKKTLLSKVKPIDIQMFEASKLDEGLSPNSVIKQHAVIRSALQYAVKNKLIKENVADLVDKPHRERYEASFYDRDELEKLLVVAKGSSIETPIVIAAWYGMRRSEVLGLKWSAIDFDNKVLTVCNKVIRGRDETGKLVSMSISRLKSETSNRTLPLCDTMIAYFKELKDKIEVNKKLFGNCYNHDYDDFVCVNPKGDLIQPDYVTSNFRQILEKNNLRLIRFHDLRHSCATLLLSLGYTMKDIQMWLGHSDYLITANTYAHSDCRNKFAMIDSMQNELSIGNKLPQC